MSDAQGPPEVAVGSVLVSLLDPVRGEEAAFHRWYERDHFYSGVMVGPGFFAGQRFVAPRSLKALRDPRGHGFLSGIGRGSYLALYWIQAGQHAEAERWAVDRVNALIAADRMHPSRRQAHAGFYRTWFRETRDPQGVPIELALDHRYPGLGFVLLERAAAVSEPDFEAWLRAHVLPEAFTRGGADSCLALAPLPLPENAPAYVEREAGLERRVLLVFFLDRLPGELWEPGFGDLGVRVEQAGRGRLLFASPFVPTVPGSDRYADDLW